MFISPPLPPKDYVLKSVDETQKSCYELTPEALPRITQTSLATFCSPIEYKENEKLANVDVDLSVNSHVLDLLTARDRCFWVDIPGKYDYFLHDIYRKYSVEVWPSYDVRFKHNERVFYRSFNYELECAEYARQEKLAAKVRREEEEEREKNRLLEEKRRKVDTMGVIGCKDIVPFWWKGEGPRAPPEKKIDAVKAKPVETVQYRWCEEPSLTDYVSTDDCHRRDDMALIDMPFRNEACNWYYKNYPPPVVRFTRRLAE